MIAVLGANCVSLHQCTNLFHFIDFRLDLYNIKTKSGHRFIYLLKHFSHCCTTWLLLWLHPSSGDDPLVWMPTAADQQNLSKKKKKNYYFYLKPQ